MLSKFLENVSVASSVRPLVIRFWARAVRESYFAWPLLMFSLIASYCGNGRSSCASVDGPPAEAPTVTAAAVRDFLTHLAVHRRVSASTQNQAQCALLFLARELMTDQFELGGRLLLAGSVDLHVGELARGRSNDRSFLGSAGDAASIEASQVGGRLIDRELGVQPSIRVRAGAPVRVMITRDLILEPYQR